VAEVGEKDEVVLDVMEQMNAIDVREVKATIEEEINRLVVNKDSYNILAFKELREKEEKKREEGRVNKEDERGAREFTS
jgi:hypothetical protein